MTNSQSCRPKRFTGGHMAAILVAGFGVVIAVNVIMASLASSTFGGIVVENSYVASQKFNGWLAKAHKAKALGWTVSATTRPDGRVVAHVVSSPAPDTVSAIARHPLGHLPDQEIAFHRSVQGDWISAQSLPAGRWMLRFTVTAGDTQWRSEQPLLGRGSQ